MAEISTLLSVQTLDGNKLPGSIVEEKVLPIFKKTDVLGQLGLIQDTAQTTGQKFKYKVPNRAVVKDYTFSKDDVTGSPNTISAETTDVTLNTRIYGAVVTESLDDNLLIGFNSIKASVIASLADSYNLEVTRKWLEAVGTVTYTNRATQWFEWTDADLALPATGDYVQGKTWAAKITEPIEKIAKYFNDTITMQRVGYPLSMVRVLASTDTIFAIEKAFGILGEKVEWFQTTGALTQVGGQLSKGIIVKGIHIYPFGHFLGSNLRAGVIHESKGLNLTNYRLLAITIYALPFVRGKREVYANRQVKSNNIVNAIKGILGVKAWDTFKTDIFAIVKNKNASTAFGV